MRPRIAFSRATLPKKADARTHANSGQAGCTPKTWRIRLDASAPLSTARLRGNVFFSATRVSYRFQRVLLPQERRRTETAGVGRISGE